MPIAAAMSGATNGEKLTWAIGRPATSGRRTRLPAASTPARLAISSVAAADPSILDARVQTRDFSAASRMSSRCFRNPWTATRRSLSAVDPNCTVCHRVSAIRPAGVSSLARSFRPSTVMPYRVGNNLKSSTVTTRSIHQLSHCR
jgi:hypothetical protein